VTKQESARRWYEFNYNGGSRISLHFVTPELVERVRRYALERKRDIVITETSR
jgi:hypothetical protein